jgi:hypothetical protein
LATVAPSVGSMMYAEASAGAGLRVNVAGAAGGAAAAGAAGAAGGDGCPHAVNTAQTRIKALRVSMGDDSSRGFVASL